MLCCVSVFFFDCTISVGWVVFMHIGGQRRNGSDDTKNRISCICCMWIGSYYNISWALVLDYVLLCNFITIYTKIVLSNNNNNNNFLKIYVCLLLGPFFSSHFGMWVDEFRHGFCWTRVRFLHIHTKNGLLCCHPLQNIFL